MAGTFDVGAKQQAELARIEAEIAKAQATANETDADGTPSAAAIVAQKSLTKLTDQYRSLLSQMSGGGSDKPQIYTDPSDGSQWALGADGTKTRLTGPKAGGATVSIPDPQHPGQMIDVTPQQAQAYINQQRADDAAKHASDTADIAGQRVDLASQTAALRAQAQDKANEIAMMNVTDAEKQRLLDEWWKENIDLPKAQLDAQTSLYSTGQSAGMDAAKLAEMGTKDLVGPGFGANFASALGGIATGDPSKVHYGANDFTYKVPDYNQIAQQGAAAAIAHLSPYAASLMGVKPPGGYQPAAAQQPGVVAAAANTVVYPQQSATNNVMQPGYRPGG